MKTFILVSSFLGVDNKPMPINQEMQEVTDSKTPSGLREFVHRPSGRKMFVRVGTAEENVIQPK